MFSAFIVCASVCARCLYPVARSEVMVVYRKSSNICDAVC